MKKKSLKYIVPGALILAAIVLCVTFFNQPKDKIKYSEIVALFSDNKVSEYTLNLGSGSLQYLLREDLAKAENEAKDQAKKLNKENLSDVELEKIKSKYRKEYMVPNVTLFVNDIHDYVVKYNIDNPEERMGFDYDGDKTNSWWVDLLPVVIIGIMTIGVLVFLTRRMGQAMSNETNRTLGFGKARIKRVSDEKRKTTFDDVAGADEEKEELSEIVAFLKEPQSFIDLGARIPKGVLLVGPPGTGKTLLARAVAGEADAPFFSISGSDFVEMYVGVGASRVRDLFEQAKKKSPSIIFIDEIDAVGRHRGAGMGGGHDEREQTLNQLLVEMDGFGANEGVIVIAATNRPDILDPALLRPGRFDRQVTVGYPDVKGREEILKVHSKGKPLAPDVDLHKIACSTVGFTGADLENLMNEAALLSARKKQKAITMDNIDEATIKVLVGTEKKSHKINDKDKKITAYHEAGHAVATYCLEGQDPVQQISIIPRGMAAGFTLSRPENDKTHISRSHMLDEIVILLGGRAAEALVMDDICTGASNDIQRATEMARNMVTKYGMSDKLGPIVFGSSNDEVFLGKDYNHMRNYSEAIASEIDSEVNKIITNSYKRVERILSENIDKLHKVSDYLFEHEKMDGKKFEEIMSE